MTFEVFIKPGFDQATIEAASAKEAANIFRDRIRDNISTEHIVTNCLDEEP